MPEPPRRDDDLPITAEVGGEGGSFADDTYQESETKDDRGRGLPRADDPRPEPPDIRREQ